DNLRRSVSPIALLVLFAFGWMRLASSWPWTVLLVGLLLVPPVAALLVDLVRIPKELPWTLHLRRVAHTAGIHARRLVVHLACLPFEAWQAVDAIARTLWRMGISRRHLLQWRPSSEVERSQPMDLAASYATM